MQAAVFRADDVLANMEGGLDDDMSADEMARNAALAEEHAELLTSHGYRLVRPPFTCHGMTTAASLHTTLLCACWKQPWQSPIQSSSSHLLSPACTHISIDTMHPGAC